MAIPGCAPMALGPCTAGARRGEGGRGVVPAGGGDEAEDLRLGRPEHPRRSGQPRALLEAPDPPVAQCAGGARPEPGAPPECRRRSANASRRARSSRARCRRLTGAHPAFASGAPSNQRPSGDHALLERRATDARLAPEQPSPRRRTSGVRAAPKARTRRGRNPLAHVVDVRKLPSPSSASSRDPLELYPPDTSGRA